MDSNSIDSNLQFVKEQKPKTAFKNKTALTKEGKEIIESIEKIKQQLDLTRQNFDMATDESLIDCYIYEIISLNKKYQYFLKLAKQSGIIAQGFEKIV